VGRIAKDVARSCPRRPRNLFTSALLLAELDDVLSRAKLSARMRAARVERHELVFGYAALSTIVTPPAISPTILDDPDDDHVLACAIATTARAIVSGDRHLLRLRDYKGIAILMATSALAQAASG
jgi:putative PIN family toxin of toxin-antitoxin system